MTATTEIAIIPMVAGSNPGDPTNPAAGVVKASGDTLASTDGCRQVNFGTQVESPDTLQMFIDWDSKGHHETFMASREYGPFLKRLESIMSGSPLLMHVDFKGAMPSALSAPVTEVATFYFGGDAPSDWTDNALKFGEVLQKDAEGCTGLAANVTYEDLEYKDIKGKAGVIAIGWQSVKAHMDYRETQSFKDNIHLLRNGSQQVEMHHVQLMHFVA